MDDHASQKNLMQWVGFLLGPLLAAVCLMSLPAEFQSAVSPLADGQQVSAAEQVPSVSQFSWAGRATLAVMVWMGIWWLSEAVHISLTALLPIVLFPWLGAATIKDATAPFADHLIFLYFGGFILALSMERWGLGKRIALITLRFVGTSAPRMIAGFMIVTAVLSAFVSNTATTAMMLPIALSVIALLRNQPTGNHPAGDIDENVDRVDKFGTCLLLTIAYSASIGGIMTIIGTPPNAFLVGFLRDSIAEEYRIDFSFAGWLPIGASLVFVFLPIMYLLLTRVLFPIGGIQLKGGKQMIESELKALGRVQKGEWLTLIVFLGTVVLWLIRPLIADIEIELGSATIHPFQGLTDTGIAMTAAMLLFVLPVDIARREFTMDWETAAKVPWGILLLFGGGLSLAAAVQANGVSEFIGSYARHFGSMPTVVVVLLVTTAIVFLTELTSNLATATSLVPVLAALAPGIGIHPYLLVFPATIAASCAFMLPVATPPNAIVFGSGQITLSQMLRAGFLLNLASIVIVTLLTMFVVRPCLGV